MKLKYRLLKVFILLLILGFMIYFAYNRFQNREIKGVIIDIPENKELQFVTDKTLNQMIAQHSIYGTNTLKELDIPAIEKDLKDNHWIDTANVYLDLDGTLKAYIIQKKPIVRVKTPKEEFYLDKDANPFPLNEEFSYPAMIAEGKITPEDYKGLVEMTEFINGDKLLKKHIVGVKKIKENDFTLLLNQGDYTLEFGDLSRISSKLLSLKEFYAQYLEFEGIDKYSKISLKYNNQIVATKRQRDKVEIN